MQIDGSIVKLADQARINRRDFIEEYRGYELDPNWLDRMAEKTAVVGKCLLRNHEKKPKS